MFSLRAVRCLCLLIATLLYGHSSLAQEPCNELASTFATNEQPIWKALCTNGQANPPATATTAVDEVTSGSAQVEERSKVAISSSFLETILTRPAYRKQLGSGGIRIDGVRFEGPVHVAAAIVEGPVIITNSEFSDFVEIRGSSFAGTVSFVGSNFLKGLRISGTQVAGGLFLGGSDDAETERRQTHPKAIAKSLNLSDNVVRGDLDILDCVIEEVTDLSNVRVEGSINLMRLTAHRITLATTQTRGQLALVASDLVQTPGYDYELLDLYSIRASQDVFLNRTSVGGTTLLDKAVIEGSLNLRGAVLGDVSGNSLVVRNSLDVGFNESGFGDTPTRLKTTWIPKSTLDLRNATIGSIITSRDLKEWPTSVNLANVRIGRFDLDGFSGGAGPQAPVISRVEWLRRWLQLQPKFSSDTYSRIRDALLANGDESAANEIGYNSRNRELGEAIENIARFDPETILANLTAATYLATSKVLIGFGYKMWLPVVWTLGFLLLGAAVFRLTGEADREHMPYGFAYSFDMFLPIIRLRDRHYEIDVQTAWARYYFYIHKIAGWIVGSFIVVGLSGFAK